MVDLTAQPFNLDDKGVRRVRETIAGMTDEAPMPFEALLDKLEGKGESTGVPATDVFCGLPETRV